MWRRIELWVCAVVVAMIGRDAAAQVQFGRLDDFEDGTTMGWAEGSPSLNPPSNVNTGGPGGAGDAFLRNVSSGGGGAGSRMVMFSEGRWLGDYNAEHVMRIQGQAVNLGTTTTLHLRLAITAGADRFGSTEAIVLPPDGLWRPVVFDLTPAAMTQMFGSRTLDAALSQVTDIRILSAAAGPMTLGDAIAGTLGMDNLRATRQPGDADFDARVTFADFQRLEVGFGTATGATWQQGDFNFDRRVDFADFQILRGAFGSGALSAEESSAVEAFEARAVPEPSLGLVVVVGGLLARRRH